MFDYARSDTHFLLYIYDNMRNELIEKSTPSMPDGNLIDKILEESKREALQRYERAFYDEQSGMGATGWYNMLIKTPALFDREQFSVFKAVHRWRDELARKEDESLNIIMPRTILFNIAREMPVDMPALFGCLQNVSRPLKQNAKDLLEVIISAKAAGASGPEMKEFLATHPATVEREARRQAWKESEERVPSAPQTQPTEPLPRQGMDLRVSSSKFWGPTVLGQERERNHGSIAAPAPSGVQLVLPLPELTGRVFADPNEASSNEIVIPALQNSHPEPPSAEMGRSGTESQIFTVKEIGGSRKRKAVGIDAAEGPSARTSDGGPMPAAEDDSWGASDPTDSQQSARERAERKAAKKAQRMLEREANRLAKARRDQAGNGQEEPFDYENAPSVLDAKPDKDAQSTAIDPYRKSASAPRGMKRAKRETAGKSFTYK
jgi:exosome complex exonuclease RRP6